MSTRAVIEAEARRYAEMYSQSSDGRNTFTMFADWVARLPEKPAEMPQNVEVAIGRMRTLADSALGSLYEVECQREMRNACVLLEQAYSTSSQSEARSLHNPSVPPLPGAAEEPRAAALYSNREDSITAGSELADWSSLPRDLYVTSVKCTDGIVFDVQCCSVPMAIGPEVRYSLAEPTERCQDCGQELPLRYPCHEQGCTINCRF